MKKRIISISVLGIVFSVIFLANSSVTKAEMRERPKRDLVEVLNIQTPRLLDAKEEAAEKKDRENNLPMVAVPLQERVHAFVDLAAPTHQALTKKDSLTDYRGVVGFHVAF